MTDSAKLREIILNSGIKYKTIAEKLGISSYALQLKIDNKNEFKSSEIKVLCEILGITSLKMKESIFFAD